MSDSSIFSEEENNLFNAAYSSFVLYASMREFEKYKVEGMHYALPFVIIPLAMNKVIASALPSTFRTPIASWVSSSEGVLSEFVDQAESYGPIVRAAIEFLVNRGIVVVHIKGHLLLGEQQLVNNPSLFGKSIHMASAFRAAKFLGKWFSHVPDTQTVFAQLGIRP